MKDRTAIILNCIREMVAILLGRTSITWDEIEEIYASGKYPEINASIDYVIS